ncbi:uncharacterized protein DMENIID0001_131520 [Sergentomyia squamirostris]
MMIQHGRQPIKYDHRVELDSGSGDDFIEEDFIDTADQIPQMELLKINYVKRVSDESRKRKNLSKYTVYKKHNFFANKASTEAASEKVVEDQGKNRRKYLIFDGRSKKTNKLDNIQFYFDNKSYERYVDNKLYGTFKANNFRDLHQRFEKNIINARKKCDVVLREKPRPTSFSDLSRISQIFEGAKRDSMERSKHHNRLSMPEPGDKKIKKLVTIDSRQINMCSHVKIEGDRSSKPNDQLKQILKTSCAVERKSKPPTKAPPPPPPLSTVISVESPRGVIKNTCGYKNCNFVNCPMSASSSSSSASSTTSRKKRISKIPINTNHDHSKYRSEIAIDADRMKHRSSVDRVERQKNIKQLESKIVTKLISDELKLHCKKTKSTEILANDNNTVKIYIQSENSKRHEDTVSTSDSDRDYGYYDQVAESVSSTESSLRSDLEKIVNFSDRFSAKLGCDGEIFWNDCYLYEDDGKCSGTTENDSTGKNCEKYICVCTGKQIDGLESRPRSMEGPPDSGISINGDTGSSPDSDNSSQQSQNQSDVEARRLKRGHVLAELLDTERIYVAEMGSILKGYRDQMLSEEMAALVPPGLQGKEDVLFGNLHELYTFHSEVFLKDLENCISTTELVALCFVQRRDTFYRLYSYYCQNIPRSEQLRETLVDTHLFLQECQKRLGHKLPLAAYLLKPVQRITKYQLLLKDLLRFSDNGTCAKELQKALDCMLIVLKCVNDSMHQIAITGFPADLSQQGELLLQDSFQVWTDSKKDLRLRLKTQQRHIFLYQKAMLFCKQASKTGHNKSTYQYKHYVKMSQIGLTESVRGDPRRFEVWLQGRQEVHTIQASTVDIKNKWVAEIKKVLLNQLEELKGEKIKQYGLNHKQLRHTTSWETSVSASSTPQRTLSCDSGEANKISNISEELPLQTPGVSSSSSEHDNQEAGAWSSDYSNSEDEYTNLEDGVQTGSKFIALADYCAMGHSEVSMREGDTVELLKVGCAGWWFVKVLGANVEGWAPAAYLESVNRRPSRIRSQDRLNEH